MGLLGKGKRDTNSVSDISKAVIIARFLITWLWSPYSIGGNQRYDLVIARNLTRFISFQLIR